MHVTLFHDNIETSMYGATHASVALDLQPATAAETLHVLTELYDDSIRIGHVGALLSYKKALVP
jgi:hypothetical protein